MPFAQPQIPVKSPSSRKGSAQHTDVSASWIRTMVASNVVFERSEKRNRLLGASAPDSE